MKKNKNFFLFNWADKETIEKVLMREEYIGILLVPDNIKRFSMEEVPNDAWPTVERRRMINFSEFFIIYESNDAGMFMKENLEARPNHLYVYHESRLIFDFDLDEFNGICTSRVNNTIYQIKISCE